MKLPCLAIVIPCYNEQPALPLALKKLADVLIHLIQKNKIKAESFLYCVDDGSQDETWRIISEAHQESPMIKGLKLSRNRGHQNALFAGLMTIKDKVDCVISIDADLQDDICVIEEMIDHFCSGSDVVYGVRKSRKSDMFLKRMTAIAFYKIIRYSNSDIIFNHADFRLLSQRALMRLNQFEERNLFLRGIIPLIGYKSTQVYYDRVERSLGKSKYTIRKMIALACDGLTSFTHFPLRFILVMGMVSFLFALIMMVWVVCAKLFSHTVPGWSSIMIPLCFMGGIQLLSVGVLGEYIAKIYLEVKRRPRYIEDSEIF
ncbi:MAG: glycosyltransferase [Gammaproteobacteria bacterium RIFCSPHIGHO2_12_FULL_40_19]|nr:MAG: glycosyltransferase [Gammaproteobacteria bacterium RIFCSPHIGHO2_12_FULL_40_19]